MLYEALTWQNAPRQSGWGAYGGGVLPKVTVDKARTLQAYVLAAVRGSAESA
jgi:hypothetical protein